MRTGRIITSAMAAITLAACQVVSDPPAERTVQDVEFLRGCWVQKDSPAGKIEAFLRLLPEGVEGAALKGTIVDVREGDWTSTTSLSFSRDGNRAQLDRPQLPSVSGEFTRTMPSERASLPTWMKPSLGGDVAIYRADGERISHLIAESDGERIEIRTAGTSVDATIIVREFSGERDGCD
jgi:hypothetical protein